MRKSCRATMAAMLITTSGAYSAGQGNPLLQQKPAAPQEDSIQGPDGTLREPTVTVVDHQEVQGILGREVRGGATEKMGLILAVPLDRTRQYPPPTPHL